MPKQSPPESGDTPALRRSARIKNVKTPPVYTASGVGSETRKRKSTPRKPRTTAEAGTERRKPTKRRSSGAEKRSSSKRKKAASPVDTPKVEEANVEEEQAVEQKSEVVHVQEEEALESSVSMIVNVPSVLESASIFDDSESELKASMASLLEQTAARANIWESEVSGPSGETQVETDKLSQNGIFANISAGDERVFGKGDDTDFPLRHQLEGLEGGTYVFSSRASGLSREDVKVLLTMDLSSDVDSVDEGNIVKMIDRTGAELWVMQNVPSNVHEALKKMSAKVALDTNNRLQTYSRDESLQFDEHFGSMDIIKESIAKEEFYRKLMENSKLEVQVSTIIIQEKPIAIANICVNTEKPDVTCIELAAAIRFIKEKHGNFIVVGNWNAFPENNQSEVSPVLAVLLGNPDLSKLIASIPNHCMVDELPLISGFEQIFKEIPAGLLSNFDGEMRPASNVWATGSVKIVAAWHSQNASLGAFAIDN